MAHQTLQPVAEEMWQQHDGDDRISESQTTAQSVLSSGKHHGSKGSSLPLQMPGMNSSALPWPSHIGLRDAHASFATDGVITSDVAVLDDVSGSWTDSIRVKADRDHAMSPHARLTHGAASVTASVAPVENHASTASLKTAASAPGSTASELELHDDALSTRTPSTWGTLSGRKSKHASEKWGGAFAAAMSTTMPHAAPVSSARTAQSVLHLGAFPALHSLFGLRFVSPPVGGMRSTARCHSSARAGTATDDILV